LYKVVWLHVDYLCIIPKCPKRIRRIKEEDKKHPSTKLAEGCSYSQVWLFNHYQFFQSIVEIPYNNRV